MIPVDSTCIQLGTCLAQQNFDSITDDVTPGAMTLDGIALYAVALN